MGARLRTVTWVGGPQDGGTVNVDSSATWVAVLEDRRTPTQVEPEEGKPPPRALQRYSVPIIDGRIVWAQRVEATPGEGEI